jgi:hypothetical protein
MTQSGREIHFLRGVDKLKVPSYLFKILAHSSDTHAYPQDMPSEVSSKSPSPEQTMGGTQHYIEP